MAWDKRFQFKIPPQATVTVIGAPAAPYAPAIPPRIEDAVKWLRESASSARAKVIEPKQSGDLHWEVLTRDTFSTIVFKLKASDLILKYGFSLS